MRPAHARRVIPCILSLATLSGFAAGQTTWFVDAAATPPGNGSAATPYTSIQFAIAQPTTVAGDTVQVLTGVYMETIDFLGKDLLLVGNGGPGGVAQIDAGGAGSAVSFVSGETSAATMTGFLIRGGTGTVAGAIRRGGGVYVNGANPTMVACNIAFNIADEGGGVYVTAGGLTLSSVVVRDNFGASTIPALDGRGGGICLDAGSTLTTMNCAFTDNDANRGAGIDATSATLMLTQTNFIDNRAVASIGTGFGGGVYAQTCNTTINGSVVMGNLAEGHGAGGGGLFIAGGTLTLMNATLEANAAGEFSCSGFFAGRGGGLNATGTVSVSDTTFIGNFGAQEGGNVHGEGQYTDCKFLTGCSQFGGGVFASGTMTLTDCLLEDNQALSGGTEDFGGGAYGLFGTLTLDRCTLRDNTAFGDGGGALGATLTSCLLIGNRAIAPDIGLDALGGGAHLSTLTDCALDGNSALGEMSIGTLPGSGGGVYMSTATGCTFFDNIADIGAAAAQSTLDRITATRNSAMMFGDGVDQSNVSNSILWANGDETGTGGSVIWSDVDGGAAGTGNINADPLFWCPDFDDFYLMATSPCRDTADPAQMDPDGTQLDMGAFPYDATHEITPTFYCRGKTNSLGCIPFLTSQGTPSPTITGPFKIMANDVLPAEAGMLIYGTKRSKIGYHGGTLCVKIPFVRGKLVPSKTVGLPPCSGRLSFNFNQRIRSGLDPSLTVGRSITAQFRQRDPADPLGFGDSLSNGMRFVICP